MIYQEYFNNILIKEIEFVRRSLEWVILELSNDCVVTRTQLISMIKGLNQFEQVNIEELVTDAINRLVSEGLMYSQKSGEECVSIINTSIIF